MKPSTYPYSRTTDSDKHLVTYVSENASSRNSLNKLGISRVGGVSSSEKFARLFFLLLFVLTSLGCSTAAKAKDQTFAQDPIESSSPEAKESFAAGVHAAEAAQGDRAKWLEAQKAFDHAIAEEGEGSSVSSLAAKVLRARTALGSLQWVASGMKSDVNLSEPEVQKAFATLKEIVETPDIDPRVHYAARLYLATIYLLAQQQSEAFQLLSDYPSNALSALILDQDRPPIRFLLAAALSHTGRHLEAAYAYERTLKDYSEAQNRTFLGGDEGESRGTSEVSLPVVGAPTHPNDTIFGDLLVNLIAEEVANLEPEDLQEAIAQSEHSRLQSLALLHVLRQEVESGNVDKTRKDEILQSLAKIEPELQAINRDSDVQTLRQHLSTKEDVSAVRNIGVILPLSGKNAVYGRQAQEAIMVVSSSFDSQNSNNPRKTRYIFEDSMKNPAEVAQKFKENNVLAVIGPLTPARTEAFVPHFTSLKIPFLSLAAVLPKRTSDYLFSFYLTPRREAEAVAKIAVKNLGDMRGVVLFSDNGYGRAMQEAFTNTYRGLGGEVVLSAAIDDNSSNYTDLAKRIESVNPKVIFFAARPEKVAEVSAFLAQQNIWGTSPRGAAGEDRRGRKFVHYLGTSIWQNSPLLQQSYSYLEGALIPAWNSPLYDNGALGARVQSQFLSATGRIADTFKVVAGDAALLANDYVVQRGIDSADAFRNELLGGAPFKGNAGSVHFSDKGEVERTLRLLEVRGGELVVSPISIALDANES